MERSWNDDDDFGRNILNLKDGDCWSGGLLVDYLIRTLRPNLLRGLGKRLRTRPSIDWAKLTMRRSGSRHQKLTFQEERSNGISTLFQTSLSCGRWPLKPV